MKKNEVLRYYQEEKDLFEISRNKERTKDVGEFTCEINFDDVKRSIPNDYRRDEMGDYPELSEVEVVRHFTRISQKNYCVDTGLYPLGSCTMKYNPKINDRIASAADFASTHPYSPLDTIQGNMEALYITQKLLCTITGMDAVTLSPSAGAQGEFVGMQMIMAYHRKNESGKDIVIIPDSAHGTNPASSALCNYRVVTVKSDERGMLSPSKLKEVMSDKVAGLMVTCPNTLGIFEENISEISDIIHEAGGLVYCDGANLNAVLGLVDFREMGVDVMHMNLHKTFSTPHGGGGPGSGPVAIRDILSDFLPVPLIEKEKDGFIFKYDIPDSIGRLRPFYGNFGVIIRALTYILSLGEEGLKAVREGAVLNSNYIKAHLKGIYHLPYESKSLHEVVLSDKNFKDDRVSTLDIAKRLMDFGFHAPTVYFPLIVKGALMIEPTETESKAEIDRFIEAMKTIAKEIKENPDILHSAPNNLGIKRLDEVHAAKNPKLTWSDSKKSSANF